MAICRGRKCNAYGTCDTCGKDSYLDHVWYGFMIDRRDRVRIEPGDCAPEGARLDPPRPPEADEPESWEPGYWFV